MKKRMILLLILCLPLTLVTAGTRQHKIFISTPSDSLDSVWVMLYTNTILSDSVLIEPPWPTVDSLLISDTTEEQLEYRWYFNLNDPKYTNTDETFEGFDWIDINNWKIRVFDSAGVDTTPLPGAQVQIRYDPGGGNAGTERTNGLGEADFKVDQVSYTVDVYFPLRGHTQQTFSVSSSGQIDSSYLYTTGFPATAGPDLCNVWTVYYRAGTPVRGAVWRVMNLSQATDTTNDLILAPFVDAVRTDSNGVASIAVPRSYLFHDSTKARYDVSLSYRGRTVSWTDVWVPNADSLRLLITE